MLRLEGRRMTAMATRANECEIQKWSKASATLLLRANDRFQWYGPNQGRLSPTERYQESASVRSVMRMARKGPGTEHILL